MRAGACQRSACTVVLQGVDVPEIAEIVIYPEGIANNFEAIDTPILSAKRKLPQVKKETRAHKVIAGRSGGCGEKKRKLMSGTLTECSVKNIARQRKGAEQ